MSVFLEKSKQNELGGVFLMDKKLLTPSIHCFYYACFHIIQYVGYEILGITEDEIQRNQKGSRGNRHRYLSQRIFQDLKTGSRGDARTFNLKLKDLKEFRIEADYGLLEVSSFRAEKAKEEASRIIKLLKKHYYL